jgi:ADP-heptose:LPS heptosyltransferase
MSPLKFLEHKIKDGLFVVSRLFLRRGNGDSSGIDGARIKKVLFLRQDKIGDMVISFPVFDALKRRFPQIKIAVVGSPRNYALIKDDPRIDHIHLYTKRPWHDLREILIIRRERYDCVLDMIDNDSATTLILSQLAAPGKPRIGIGKIKFAPFYDYNFPHSDNGGGHCIDNAVELLIPFGIAVDDKERFAPPFVPADAHVKVDRFMKEIAGSGPLVGFNLSAGMPTRLWAAEKAKALTKMLVSLPESVRVILIVTRGDFARGEEVLKAVNGHAWLVPRGLNLLEVSALIARLDLLISPDTSLIHIARSYQVPVVGLYSGAERNFRRWHPYRQSDGSVVSDCVEHLFDITPEQVMAETRRVLARMKGATS